MIEVSGASDIGCVRTSNEDSFGVFDGVYVVADGLGGHAAGEVASRMVVAAVEELSRRGAGDAAALVAAVQEANARVHRAAEENPAYEGMGSTATVLRIDEGTGMAYYAHVGDSRLYLLRSGILRQVSRDHSYVEELVAQGKISEDEAQHHPRKNLLMRRRRGRSDRGGRRRLPLGGGRPLPPRDGRLDEYGGGRGAAGDSRR